MGKECQKCGYVRATQESAPDYECPSCGRVYIKVEKAKKKEEDAGSQLTDKSIMRFWVIGLAIVGGAIFSGLYFSGFLSDNQIIVGTLSIFGDSTSLNGRSSKANVDIGDECWGIGGFSDITEGSQVIVKDGAGALLGIGSISKGVVLDWNSAARRECMFTLGVGELPDSKYYVINIGRRGEMLYDKKTLESQDWSIKLRLGDKSETVEHQVTRDFTKQYQMAKKQGDAIQVCAQAGMVSAAYLQENDQANYNKWKAIEKSDCYVAGVRY